MPNPLSRWFHLLPRPLHRVEVAANHVAQLVAPVLLFAPQPIRTGAAAFMIVTQGYLMLSGNFAWLNLLTIVIGFAGARRRLRSSAAIGLAPPTALEPTPLWFDVVVGVPSPWSSSCCPSGRRGTCCSQHQRMNASFDPLHLVNTYGAFGSITRHRDEIVDRGHRRPRPRPGHGVAGVRVQGQAHRPRAASPAGGALPPAPRLAAVVRAAVGSVRRPVAGAVPAGPARGRPRHLLAARPQPVPRRAARCGPGAAATGTGTRPEPNAGRPATSGSARRSASWCGR